jgi:WD40 repeat protein
VAAITVAVVVAVTAAVIVAIVVVGDDSRPGQTEVAAPGGTRVRTIDVGHTGNVRSIVFSPDGKLVATASLTMVRLWDPATAETVRTLPIELHWSLPLAFSPDVGCWPQRGVSMRCCCGRSGPDRRSRR